MKSHWINIGVLLSILMMSCTNSKIDKNITQPFNYQMSEILYEALLQDNTILENDTLKQFLHINLKIYDREYTMSPLKKYSSNYDIYSKGFDYYMNYFKEDIYLIYDDEFIEPVVYQFEPAQGFLPYETIVIGFVVPINLKIENVKLKILDRFVNQGVHILLLN